MNRAGVSTKGLHGERPDREALTGAVDRVGHNGSAPKPAASEPGVDGQARAADVAGYYGQPVIKEPTWKARDIAGYLFLGGLAGASSILAAGAQLTRRHRLARTAKVTASGAIALSLAALVHDLGRPGRFYNMLRVMKPTSPMSIGSWMLATYAPLSITATATEVLGVATPVGAVATFGAAGLGAGVATYTGALVANTAVPAWHDGHREMPLLFAASAASAAGGAGLLAGTGRETAPARRVAIAGALAEVAFEELMVRRMPATVARSYHDGRAGKLLRLGKMLALGGAATATLAGRSRAAGLVAGGALLSASALTRFGVFHAGVESARDPQQTIGPQRARREPNEVVASPSPSVVG